MGISERRSTRLLAAAGVTAAVAFSPLVLGCATAATPSGAAVQPAAAQPADTQPAAATQDDLPSACRPGNNAGLVFTDRPSAGHQHYRVILVAGPATSDCTLSGPPTAVGYTSGGEGVSVQTTSDPAGARPVVLGPGKAVHFDLSVPNTPGALVADDVTFTLNTADGEIPGVQSATGGLQVTPGARVGSIQPGL